MSPQTQPPTSIDKTREQLRNLAASVSDAEVESTRADAPPPPGFLRRHRRIILVGALCILAALFTVKIVQTYFYYNPWIPHLEPNPDRDTGFEAAVRARLRDSAPPETGAEPTPNDSLRRGPLMDGDKDLDDIPIGRSGGLGKP